MKERPILFSGPMIRAILSGNKVQTRRVITPQPPTDTERVWYADRPLEGGWESGLWYPVTYPGGRGEMYPCGPGFRCPFGVPGDSLYVRETWQHCPECGGVNWRACGNEGGTVCQHCDASLARWKSPIHMFKDYARLWLEVVSVRAERLNDISVEDARAEGYDWLWVIEFRRMQ